MTPLILIACIVIVAGLAVLMWRGASAFVAEHMTW